MRLKAGIHRADIQVAKRQKDPITTALCELVGKVWGIPASKGWAATTAG